MVCFPTFITALTPCWAGVIFRHESHPATPITRLSSLFFLAGFLESLKTTSWTTTPDRVHLRRTWLHTHLAHLSLHGFMSPGGVLQYLQCYRTGFLQDLLSHRRIRTLIHKLIKYGLVDICKFTVRSPLTEIGAIDGKDDARTSHLLPV